MYQVAYNPEVGNALVGVAPSLPEVPSGIVVATFDGDMPDMSRWYWNTSLLSFQELANTKLSPTEFMRRFTFPERLAIRSLERNGDLVVTDALALMNGTKDGIDVTDPDVVATLGYLVSQNVIEQSRVEEILQ